MKQNLASTQEVPIASFLKEVMRRRRRLPSQLASDLGVSHATVRRWLLNEDVPSMHSCRMLAEYSGVSIQKVLSIAGHLPRIRDGGSPDLPEFREYVHVKYPSELSEELVTVLEELIERRREVHRQRRHRQNSNLVKHEPR